MAGLRWPKKDPQERLDYSLHWNKELTPLEDTIFTSSWRVDGPDALLLLGGDGVRDFTTYVWLEGGTDGALYQLVNTIETGAGRVYERTVTIQVSHQ